ncbi:MAG: ABC transporter ATP-binding protein [Anaerolineales bacterium]|nr:ABC transporter ATP-binding protein [Anaerolineales bacterium]
MSDTLLEIKNLRKLYRVPRGIAGLLRRQPRKWVHAVDGISFEMRRGEILALVGESGSGKTTTGLCILGLKRPSKGQILFEGEDVNELASGRRWKDLRRRAQLIFQDPYESLNPRQTVFEAVAEPLEVHHLVSSKAEKFALVKEKIEDAGLKPAEDFFHRYPQELSGGQRQRVVIASGLALDPHLLVADEPVSMLDVSIRAEILNLLLELRDNQNIAMLYITHDLATAAYVADRVAVMYLGVIVEIGPAEVVLDKPFHPYTQALLSVIPSTRPENRGKRIVLEGDPPDPIDLPSGCRFHPRCPVVMDECRHQVPALQKQEDQHYVMCGLATGAWEN